MITNSRSSGLLDKFSFKCHGKCVGKSKENLHTDVGMHQRSTNSPTIAHNS